MSSSTSHHSSGSSHSGHPEHTGHPEHSSHPANHNAGHAVSHPKIKVPYSKNPVFVAEGYTPPIVAGRSFEYETSTENVAYWGTLSLAYRQYLKKEADTRRIDLRLLIDERRNGAFKCVSCNRPMVLRENFTNGDRFYQCVNGDCVKRVIRYHYLAQTGRVIEVA